MEEGEANAKIVEQRRRLGMWIFVGGFLFLCVSYVVLNLAVPGKSDLQQWLDARRAEGEEFTLEEIYPAGFGDHTTNKIGEVERLLLMLDPQLSDMSGAAYHVVSNGVAVPAWQMPDVYIPSQVGTTNVLPAWRDWSEAVDASRPVWDEILRLLPIPDRDLGDALRRGSSRRINFVKKRVLLHQLCSVVVIELQRNDPQRARNVFHAALRWPEWHGDHNTLVNHMMRVGMSQVLVNLQWTMLQYPGWTNGDLKFWQRHWTTNTIISEYPRALRVERSQVFADFEVIKQGGDPFSGFGGGAPSVAQRMAGGFWSLLLADADQLYYARHMQRQIDLAERASESPDYAVAGRDVSRLMSDLNRDLGTTKGKLLFVSGMTIPSLEKVLTSGFKYEVARELAITGIALRRFHRKHDSFPARLDELIPEFLPTLSVDWMTGTNLVYRPDPNGWFELRSVGPNGTDEGGKGDDILWYRSADRTSARVKASDMP